VETVLRPKEGGSKPGEESTTPKSVLERDCVGKIDQRGEPLVKAGLALSRVGRGGGEYSFPERSHPGEGPSSKKKNAV